MVYTEMCLSNQNVISKQEVLNVLACSLMDYSESWVVCPSFNQESKLTKFDFFRIVSVMLPAGYQFNNKWCQFTIASVVFGMKKYFYF